MNFLKSASLAAGAVAAVALAPVRDASAETVLKAVTGVSSRSVVSQVFLRWVKVVNEKGKGLVRIDYMGGPEITPPFQQAQALKRGLFDILYAPAAFYAGDVKEVDALIASNVPVETMRKNGAMAYLNKLWRAQLNAHIIGWFDTYVRFQMYLDGGAKVNVPTTPAGLATMLKGIKMFTTPTFREFQIKLGATPVSLKITEIMSAMDKGVITGMGWPEYGMTGLGFTRVIKQRIDPNYYRGNIMTLINGRKWDSLPQKVKDFLTSEAIAYEIGASREFVKREIAREQGELKAAGMKVIELKGDVAKAYRKMAHDIAWARLARRSPSHVKKLRELMYDPSLN